MRQAYRAAKKVVYIVFFFSKKFPSLSTTSILQELVDDSVFAVVIEEHRKIKLGLHCPTKLVVRKDCSAAPPQGLVDVPGYDVFGLQPAKVAGEAFPCPNCASMRHPSKFAPHLEKCMGMGGRESRRVAANRSRQQADARGFDGGSGDFLAGHKRGYDAI